MISINNNVTLQFLKIIISFYCFKTSDIILLDEVHFAGNVYFAPDQAIITRKKPETNALLGVAAGIVADDYWLTTKNNL